MPDTFEHLDYTFKLKFSKVPLPHEPKITEFNFSIDDKSSEPITETDPITEIEFKDIEQPSGNINLVISGNTDVAKAVMDKLKIAGKEFTSKNGTDYTFILNNAEYTSGAGISMTDQ
tara:strand:- start:667 stop:1017 length:351 start_codon:yes stop_codon:yes gene_type:complete